MRQTQYIGLTEDAKEFLEECSAEVICEFPGATGMFDEPITLKMWQCKFANHDDMMGYATPYDFYFRTFVEVVQEVHWSSGPMIFTCLLDTNTSMQNYKWSQESMINY